MKFKLSGFPFLVGTIEFNLFSLGYWRRLSAANMKRQLGETHNLDDFFFSISVYQKTAIRDWHFALLTCGLVAQWYFLFWVLGSLIK